jgi:hypothetical protein
MMTGSTISESPVENLTAGRRRDHQLASAPASRPPTPKAISSTPTPAKAGPTRDGIPRRTNITPKIFGTAVVFALWIGWLSREDNGLTAANGVGYWLGIAGSVLMLVLLLYPLRKRIRSLRAIGTVAFWFHAHMVLGVLGPVLILWHANFRLGSINCSVALVTMLVVAGSGVIGRYLYSKIHLGLYGRKAQAQQVVADADELRGFIGADPSVADRMVAHLNAFAQLGTTAPKGVFAGLVLPAIIGWRGAVIQMRLIADARRTIVVEGRRRRRSPKAQRQQLAGVTDFVTRHVGAAKKAATFAAYERLFRLWHIFHVPLFVLLMIVAIIHVFASHFF